MRSLLDKLIKVTQLCDSHVLSLSSDSICDLSFLLLVVSVRLLIINTPEMKWCSTSLY